MIILFHVVVALAGIGNMSYLLLRPSRAGFRLAYGLLAATIASGAYLLLASPVHITQTCVSGLTYIGLVLSGLIAARLRLARVPVTHGATRRELR